MFILIFHGDLNYRKNTNILVEWWPLPLASSCILAGQLLTVHSHVIIFLSKLLSDDIFGRFALILNRV